MRFFSVSRRIPGRRRLQLQTLLTVIEQVEMHNVGAASAAWKVAKCRRLQREIVA